LPLRRLERMRPRGFPCDSEQRDIMSIPTMKPVPPSQQQALAQRLMTACGGSYSPQTRRKYFISGPQWAAAYQGQALFHAPTREPVGFERVIEEYARIGIGHWTTHDTDVIPTEALGKDQQADILGRIGGALKKNGV